MIDWSVPSSFSKDDLKWCGKSWELTWNCSFFQTCLVLSIIFSYMWRCSSSNSSTHTMARYSHVFTGCQTLRSWWVALSDAERAELEWLQYNPVAFEHAWNHWQNGSCIVSFNRTTSRQTAPMVSLWPSQPPVLVLKLQMTFILTIVADELHHRTREREGGGALHHPAPSFSCTESLVPLSASPCKDVMLTNSCV